MQLIQYICQGKFSEQCKITLNTNHSYKSPQIYQWPLHYGALFILCMFCTWELGLLCPGITSSLYMCFSIHVYVLMVDIWQCYLEKVNHYSGQSHLGPL